MCKVLGPFNIPWDFLLGFMEIFRDLFGTVVVWILTAIKPVFH